ERLLTDDGTGGLVVYIKVACSKTQSAMRIGNRTTVWGENAASQSIGGSRVNNGQDFVPLPFGVNVQRDHRTKQFFAHCAIVRPPDLDQGRPDEISDRIIGLTTGDDLSILGPPRILD